MPNSVCSWCSCCRRQRDHPEHDVRRAARIRRAAGRVVGAPEHGHRRRPRALSIAVEEMLRLDHPGGVLHAHDDPAHRTGRMRELGPGAGADAVDARPTAMSRCSGRAPTGSIRPAGIRTRTWRSGLGPDFCMRASAFLREGASRSSQNPGISCADPLRGWGTISRSIAARQRSLRYRDVHCERERSVQESMGDSSAETR